nr:PREDICTED: galectin-4-like isoform X2 [Anolis carolinensis]|eukprot:XP_016853537.1 PREDICTED: galectin-4-like isoform X2 [Anolis carolinensis]
MSIVWESLELPLNRPIPLGLAPESWVLLEGFIPPESKGFCLDFVYGLFRGANIPLRIQLSFAGSRPPSSAIITLNAFIEGQWGKEVRVPAHIGPGENFKMQLIVTRKGYKIMENDTFLCDFEHRLPVNRISFLNMDGDITLKSFKSSWENGNIRRRLR